MKQSKKLLHICIYALLLVVLSSYFSFNQSNVLAEAKEEKWRVLYISSYNQNFETVPQQIEGIREVLTEDSVQLDFEYMDTKRFYSEEAIKIFYTMMSYKLSKLPVYDAVMLGDDAALQFALDYQEELFSGVPLIFLGINDVARGINAGKDDNITGVLEEASLTDTIEIALKFQPGAKRIVAIVDDTLTGIGDKAQFYMNEKLYPQLIFEDINTSKHTYEEVAELVSEITDDTILLYLSMYADVTGKNLPLDESTRLLVENANVPIYRQSIGGVGEGILGGNMVSYVKSGNIAGNMVYEVLNGKKVSDIEVVTKSPMQYIFDYDMIKKYKIDVDLIPKNALLVNREISFYEKHKGFMRPLIWIFGALSFMLIFFVLDDIRRRKFSRELKESHNRLIKTYEELAATEQELRTQYSTIQEYADSIEKYSNHDYLTNLPNRKNFAVRLEFELKKKRPCTIFLMDVDNFKRINDTLGHIYGDMLLKEIADRFLTIKDEKLYISRFGGDEFLLLLLEDDLDEIQSFIWKIQELFEKPFLMNLKENYIQFSIGIARYPKNGRKVDELIACADTAMYQAKYRGKNHYLFYENEMQKELINLSKIEDILRTAIQEDGFILAYQPQVCVKTGEIVGFEALLRLKNHNISPNQFIVVAEDTNLILEIGRIVTSKVIEQLVSWREEGLELKPVSINFSSKQIRDKTYTEFLDGMLKTNDILPSYIELEITESIFLENTDNILEFLNELRKIGISLSLDDFGSGFASINYLTYVPVDKIKLDKSLADKFLKSDSKKTMESIILLAHSLNLKITAEGIEEFEQYTRLSELKCDYIQGYLFSKPLNSNDVADIYNLNLLERVLHREDIK